MSISMTNPVSRGWGEDAFNIEDFGETWEDKKMRRVDMETIILCAIIAIAGAFGVLAGGAAFLGVRFQDLNSVWLTGGGCTLGGLLWGILLIFNSNMVSKRG